jgi:hypothetical protein
MEDNQGELFDMNEDQLFDIHYGGATAGDWKARTPQPDNPSLPKYRYGEDEFLTEVKEYVANTYQGHYVGGGQYQTVDIWNTLGSASTTCRDTAIKYLMRYGKKGGNNKKDLLKAIHYITLLNHFSQESNNDETYR